jgi:hypothetical protein
VQIDTVFCAIYHPHSSPSAEKLNEFLDGKLYSMESEGKRV